MLKHIVTHQDALALFCEFSKSSMAWCISESDASTSTVSKAIDLLVTKTERVAKMSVESLAALNATKKTFEDHLSNKKMSPVIINSLISSLMGLSREHEEVRSIINPIIENLQYQDRFRQRLENLGKIMSYWIRLRDDFLSGKKEAMTAIGEHEFGTALLGQTTSVEERDAIRKHFPSLPKESRVEDTVTLF
jgi:hypothetical protein